MLNDYKGLSHLKSMDIEQLRKLSDELREEIISCVSKNGGHLASSLGAVDIAIALHYVFNSPYDKIIWDVGHQAYAHKLLTGRDLSSLRSKNGVAGFPKPQESEHDQFVAGHAGVSVSQAAGLAKMYPGNFSIAVIGDGSMTSGMVYEAMNHAGSMGLGNLVVVLNDNEMSISKNVGAISSFISKNIINSTYYQKVRSEIKSLLASAPLQKTFNIDLVELVKKIRSSAVTLIAPEAFFEAFGFRYIGPIDGHDMEVLIKTFRNIPFGEKDPAPILLHLVTKKGKGYPYAEEDPSLFHGISCFNTKTGRSESKRTQQTFTSVFGETLTELASKDSKVVAVTAAMKEGTGLDVFERAHKDKFYDVGIAEQHAVAFASALAKSGLKPVVAIYSTFMQRSIDQVFHDIALNNLHVVFCMDRAGLVGEDGSTHHGVFDISLLRCIPTLTMMSPSNAPELSAMMEYALEKCSGPVFIRYPRGCAPEWEYEDLVNKKHHEIKDNSSRLIFSNNAEKEHLTIFGLGYSAYVCLEAVKQLCELDPKLPVKLYDPRFIKPIDIETLKKEFKSSMGIITVEENSLCGGYGSAVLEAICDEFGRVEVPFKRIGIKDHFVEHAAQNILRTEEKIDVESVKSAILDMLRKNY
jgi:1-deoxy-D-xylulose-5-phosphate synthase